MSDFSVSGQPITNENCLDFKTSDDMDIKLGPVTKLEKGYTGT